MIIKIIGIAGCFMILLGVWKSDDLTIIIGSLFVIIAILFKILDEIMRSK